MTCCTIENEFYGNGGEENMLLNECDVCGAALDPGERCNCESEIEESDICDADGNREYADTFTRCGIREC